jgi:putative aldouronate transport system substrate-binding protein
MKKRIIALLCLCAILSGVSTSCAGTATPTEQNTGETTTSASQSAGAASSEPAEPGVIHPMRYVQPGNTPPDADTGVAAVNAKLKADGYDIEFQYIRIPWDAYDQKINLMLSSGDEFEMIHIMQDVKNLTSIASRDALIPIDEYLDKYPAIADKFSETDWQAVMYQGKKYAVPVYWRSFDNALGYLTVRTDAVKRSTDEFPVDSVDETIELMKKMQTDIEAEVGKKPFHWPHQLTVQPSWLHMSYDTYPFYVENSLGMVLIRQDGTVDSFYESEEFKKDVNTYYEMYQAGLIYPDILNIDHQLKYSDFEIGAALPSPTFDYGNLPTLLKNIPDADMDILAMYPEKPRMIYTLAQNLNAMSATAEDPESGLKFLNWLYTSKENHDLFHYGIEGTHYTASSDNRIKQITDDGNNNLYYFDTWMTGYLPWLRYAEELPEKAITNDQYVAENKVVSPAAGFLFDATNISSELATLQTEIIASVYPIKFGLVSYEEGYESMISKLKSAGLDKYLEEYRTQFSKYLEEHPDAIS